MVMDPPYEYLAQRPSRLAILEFLRISQLVIVSVTAWLKTR